MRIVLIAFIIAHQACLILILGLTLGTDMDTEVSASDGLTGAGDRVGL